MNRNFLAILVLAVAALTACSKEKAPVLTAEEARGIAKDAYIYGFPLVDSYRVQYSYFVDPNDPEYKGDWNMVHNTARVYTPDDKTIQTPNSDTPYSMAGVDLRTEPLVLTVPAVPAGRYYSVQFIDLYTFNFAYAGSRTMGNEAANFLLVGPDWKGETPQGIKAVYRCETQLALVVFRTQLFNPSDIEKVKAIQEGYRIHPLSQMIGTPAPTPAPPIDFVKPLTAVEEKTSLEFFNTLNFVLQFCRTDSTETAMMARFAKLNIGAGKKFEAETLAPDILQAVTDGMKDAWGVIAEFQKEFEAGVISSVDMFGTREYMKGNYTNRFAAAVLGIYGNSKDEAIYPAYRVDSAGTPLSGANKYMLHFAKDQLPPVNAFWSVTMYELPSSLLYDNALDRYLINSPMLPKLKRDKDDGLTIYIQHASPGPKLQANWLPAPAGGFQLAMRLYWPKPEALDGTWKNPPLERVQ